MIVFCVRMRRYDKVFFEWPMSFAQIHQQDEWQCEEYYKYIVYKVYSKCKLYQRKLVLERFEYCVYSCLRRAVTFETSFISRHVNSCSYKQHLLPYNQALSTVDNHLQLYCLSVFVLSYCLLGLRIGRNMLEKVEESQAQLVRGYFYSPLRSPPPNKPPPKRPWTAFPESMFFYLSLCVKYPITCYRSNSFLLNFIKFQIYFILPKTVWNTGWFLFFITFKSLKYWIWTKFCTL